jgi:hypothetical protein
MQMRRHLAITMFALMMPSIAIAQDSNYPGRKPIIVNTCPFVELSAFSFENKYADRRTRFETSMSWKNVGTQPLIAFEIVILKYDAFDRRLIGERWTVTGVNSADWRPLQPGAQSKDGTIGLGEEEVFTAIAYVRSARLADNTVWTVNDTQLVTELRKVIPGIKDFGDLKPDPKGKTQ